MADFYWYGGSGNWNDYTNHWSLNDGDSPHSSTGAVPGVGDNVIFNNNSGLAGATVTINVASNCNSFTWSYAGGTLAGTSALSCYGSFFVDTAITRTYTGTITFKSTSVGNLITTGNKQWYQIIFNGVGGEWQIQDSFNCGQCYLSITKGSVDFNEKVVTCAIFTATDIAVKTLDFSNCTINVYNNWNITTSANVTLTMTGSTLNFIGSSKTFTGGGKAYNIVNITGWYSTIDSWNSFNQLIITGGSSKTSSITFKATQDINAGGVFSCIGNSVTNRLLVTSNTLGTSRLIACPATATVTATNCDLRDIDLDTAIDLSGSTGGIGDCGGNAIDITFTTPGTFYYNGAGNWDVTGNWFTGSGGGGSAGRVPLPQDTGKLDASSGNITLNMLRIGSLDCTGYVSTLGIGQNVIIYGSIALVTGMTYNNGSRTLFFYGRGSYNIDTQGKDVYFVDLYFGTFTLQSNLTLSSQLNLTSGIFNANNYNVTSTFFQSSNSNVRTLTMGSGTWTLTSNDTNWNVATATNLTLNCNTSTIKFTSNNTFAKTFSGGGKTYYKLWVATQNTGTFTIVGNNTFNEIIIDAGRTVNFTSGSTQIVTTFTAIGTAGSGIVLQASSTTNWVLSCSAGTITVEYCTITKSTAQGGATFNAYDSIDSGTPPNSGWNFLSSVTFKPKVYMIT